jgi:neuronal cell adhesion molecule, putative
MGSDQELKSADWFVGIICAIALAIVLAIIVCIVKRNRGGKYSVHDKESKQRKDIDYGEDAGFDEYSKHNDPHVGSRTSLTSSLRHHDGTDTDSMGDFGEDDSSKFGEDGSFIGQYGADTKKKSSQIHSPTGVATFV